MTTKEADKKPDATKIAKLLSVIGLEALERYTHFEWQTEESEPEDKTKYKVVLKKFEKELAGMKKICVRPILVLELSTWRRAII